MQHGCTKVRVTRMGSGPYHSSWAIHLHCCYALPARADDGDAVHRDGAGIELKHNNVQDQGPRAPKSEQATPEADPAQ